MTRAVDLFAGVGVGVALRELGIEEIGIDIDPAVIRLRDALGLVSVQASVADLNPADFGPCDLCWASPPCTTFSGAGNGGGRRLLSLIIACLRECAAGSDTRAERTRQAIEALKDEGWADDKAERDGGLSMLVVEPLRWVLALNPGFVGLEQVPAVLPIWQVTAGVLEAAGYSTWCGIVSAERFGVPQTRQRAILLASHSAVAHPPAPTHQAYRPGEGQRTEYTLDGVVDPWISMAEALSWTANVPAPTVTSGGTETGGAEVFAGGGVVGFVARSVPACEG